jgi:hypothetical protein
MKESREVLHKYATDMLGVEKHFADILDWQVSDTRLKEYSDADALVRKIRETLRGHIDMLERYIGSLGVSETESTIKKAITKISGMRQEDSVMRNMRDNYTALNMTAISYTMLHTTALAHHDGELAEIALQHLKQITPLVVEVSRIIPQLVVEELHAQDKALDISVAHEAISNTQRAWERDVLG